MTFLYTQTDEAREREHVHRILERLRPVRVDANAAKLAAMPAEGGVQ
jgi:hypothetical protein